MKNHRKLLAATGIALALALTGCWGDDDSDTTAASTDVPDSAGISTASFVSFILGLDRNDESSEPLLLRDTFVVPADEAAEPTPLT